MNDVHSILFVCLGNICRSPLAEGIFLHLAVQRGARDRFLVDSCGIGHWHIGNQPDSRAQDVARRNGVKLPSRARQVDPSQDWDRFDLLLPMDRSNKNALLKLGAPKDRVRLIRSFDPTIANAKAETLDVPDPYYGGADGFDRVFTMLERACEGLLDEITR